MERHDCRHRCRGYPGDAAPPERRQRALLRHRDAQGRHGRGVEADHRGYGAQLKAKTVTEVPNGITFAGGVPIMRGSELIGAVGTSGVTAAQDEIISKAGASAIK